MFLTKELILLLPSRFNMMDAAGRWFNASLASLHCKRTMRLAAALLLDSVTTSTRLIDGILVACKELFEQIGMVGTRSTLGLWQSWTNSRRSCTSRCAATCLANC